MPVATPRQAAVRQQRLRKDLLRWYRRNARDLPWRRTRDPYAIWVSEAMLQQTRIDVATPYYRRWMQRFPTIEALAQADPEDVLRAWAGLGYYSRARNLHAAARQVAADGARMPRSAAALRKLPGIGAYTAGAIASIAFGQRVAAVDGNVVRVLARLNAWPGAAASPTLKAKVDRAAAALVPAEAPGDWNQALMDLGATVCTPRSPRCDACPAAALCRAKARGLQQRIPAPKAAFRPPVERRAFAVVEHAGRILLVRNPSRGLLADLWSLPGGATDSTTDSTTPSAAESSLPDIVLAQTGHAIVPEGPTALARHQFSHRVWEMSVQRARLVRESPEGGATEEAGTERAEIAWVPWEALDGQALPSAIHKALAAVGVAGVRDVAEKAMARPAMAMANVGKPKRRQGSGPS